MRNAIKKGVQQADQSNAKPQKTAESRQRNYTINEADLSTSEPHKTILGLIGSGKNNAVHLDELCIKTGFENRYVRKRIEELRRNGKIIISSNDGYFLPSCRFELEQYIKRETHRAKSIFFTLKHARELNKKFVGMGE